MCASLFRACLVFPVSCQAPNYKNGQNPFASLAFSHHEKRPKTRYSLNFSSIYTKVSQILKVQNDRNIVLNRGSASLIGLRSVEIFEIG